MKPVNGEIKGRKVAGFFENIFKNFPTLILGTICFALIFLGYYMINDKVEKQKNEYAAVISLSMKYKDDDSKKVSLDDMKDALKSDTVKEVINEEVSMNRSFSSFIEDAQADYDDGVFSISYFHDDEAFAKTVVSKLYSAVSTEIMENFDVENVVIEKPVFYKIYDRSGGDVDNMGMVSFTVLGAIIGAVITLVLICSFYLLDNTVKNAVDVKRYLDLPVLSVIPQVNDKEEE